MSRNSYADDNKLIVLKSIMKYLRSFERDSSSHGLLTTPLRLMRDCVGNLRRHFNVRLANVTELESPVFFVMNEYIGTFQITMKNFFLMEVVETTCDLVQTLIPENKKM